MTTALRIGEVATRAGVSPRTLRYYEELGLLSPSSKTTGGARRYGDDDVARLLRIRQLQELMGFDLNEIAAILEGEDRLSDLRQEWYLQESPQSRAAILGEAVKINDRLQEQVRRKRERLDAFLADLGAKRDRYTELEAKLATEVAAGSGGAPVTQS